MKHLLTLILVVSAMLTPLILSGGFSELSGSDENKDRQTVYELRTYTTYDGKLEALHRRFEDHTLRLFEKHGMKNIAYWTPNDPDLKNKTLIYVISHENAEAATASWEAFRTDPEWQKAYEASHADGPIVQRVESVFMSTTAYSPMK